MRNLFGLRLCVHTDPKRGAQDLPVKASTPIAGLALRCYLSWRGVTLSKHGPAELPVLRPWASQGCWSERQLSSAFRSEGDELLPASSGRKLE